MSVCGLGVFAVGGTSCRLHLWFGLVYFGCGHYLWFVGICGQCCVVVMGVCGLRVFVRDGYGKCLFWAYWLLISCGHYFQFAGTQYWYLLFSCGECCSLRMVVVGDIQLWAVLQFEGGCAWWYQLWEMLQFGVISGHCLQFGWQLCQVVLSCCHC